MFEVRLPLEPHNGSLHGYFYEINYKIASWSCSKFYTFAHSPHKRLDVSHAEILVQKIGHEKGSCCQPEIERNPLVPKMGYPGRRQ